MEEKNNTVTLCGTVNDIFKLSHEIEGEEFSKGTVSVKRSSGIVDIIPIVFSERLDVPNIPVGERISLTGQVRSRNSKGDDESKLSLFIFADLIENGNTDDRDVNDINLTGYICKNPVHKSVIGESEVTSIIIAVHRRYGKSDFIPCVAWNEYSKMIEGLPLGTKVQIHGKFRSREYIKNFGKEGECQRTAHEILIKEMRIVEGEYEDSVG